MANEVDAAGKQRGRKAALRDFLTQCRARLQPEDVGLASVGRRRVPGLRREEVAELTGITPAWYTQLETGCDIRVSPRVLERLAASLRLSNEETIYLFSLAIEELEVLGSALRPQTQATLEAFTSMRAFSRRLWAATTKEEALAVAREECALAFGSDAVFSAVRGGPGEWAVQWSDDSATVRRVLEFKSYTIAHWSPALRDELHLFQKLPPGEVITRSELTMSPELASHFADALEAVDLPAPDYAVLGINSRNGLIARLATIYERPRTYSKTDRAIMRAVADLVSYALADSRG